MALAILLLSVRALAADNVAPERSCGSLYGILLDQDTQLPVAGTQVYIEQIKRSGYSHEDGHFYLPALPFGNYTLRTFRIGYQNVLVPVSINRCDTVTIEISLKSTPLSMETIVVLATANKDMGALLQEPTFLMEGKKLRQQLGKTIAETLADEPGLDQRTMGPAPARPILRGLGGDRLLVLEDGERTGDLSATSADHAVVIEPMTADRVEVIRGPEALTFGANTLGGVINVARGIIPTTHLDHVHGTATYQGETVNRGHSGGFSLVAPFGPLALRLDGSGRNAEDLQTPQGSVHNTDIRTLNGSIGLGWVRPWGNLGAAGSYYQSDYGIPGGFVGAHPKGVDIQLERQHSELRSEFFFQNHWLRQVELRAAYSRYFHQEFESSGILGLEFGVLSWHFSASARLRDRGRFKNGVIGIWSEYRDFAAGGLVFTPPTIEKTLAGFIYQEAVFGPLGLSAALRYDSKNVTPEFEKNSSRIGRIRERHFGHGSAAVSAVYRLRPQVHLGTTWMRSFRAPGLEELFSEGPHLAAYAFEVGNPELGQETGLGSEIFIHFEHDQAQAQLTAFRNDISGYIFPRNTGRLNYRTLLPIYQFTGLNALMVGSEFRFDLKAWYGLALGGSLAYVRGELSESQTPLPWMPPLSARLDLRYNLEKLTLGATLRAAASQERLGEFEQRTAGYCVYDLFGQYTFSAGHWLNSVDLVIANLNNATYRRHLSRVKSIMPEPGRSIKLLYKVYF